MEKQNTINQQVKLLEYNADEKIKPFYNKLPKKLKAEFLKVLNEYTQINIKIEEIIKYG